MANVSDEEILALIRKLDQEHWAVEIVLEGMGLTRVKDTFVGDTTTVRGVSGGERKRVTVAELLGTRVPIMCCDEISTGLDGTLTLITKSLAQCRSHSVTP
jgi:ABC-type multidrug transport system ATPase subunit